MKVMHEIRCNGNSVNKLTYFRIKTIKNLNLNEIWTGHTISGNDRVLNDKNQDQKIIILN